MKQRVIGFLVVLVLFGLVLYTQKYFGRVVMHETLSEVAKRPDMFFKNAKDFADNHRFDRSSYHIEMAIKAIRKVEKDLDLSSIDLLENGINELEIIHDQLLKDSLLTDAMFKAFEYSLNTLAVAELRASEVYAEDDHRDLANLALKHAQLHLKNAMQYENFMSSIDTMHLQVEARVFQEIDSLIENETISTIAVTERIDEILREMDQLIEAGIQERTPKKHNHED